MTDVENAIESSFVCGICDDDEVVHETVENYLKEYAQSKSIQISVISYYSSDELLEKKDYLNMLFLDIEMPGKDGIELGHILKEKGVDYKIVMLSGMVDRYKEAFKINAFRFVSKPISKKELFLAIDDVMELMEGTETLIAYKDGNSYSIKQKDIVYIEAVSSGIIACVGNTEFTIYKPLSELMDELNGKLFFRSHRSYIVNIHKIQEIYGQKALLSRRERKALVQAYVEYDIKRR